MAQTETRPIVYDLPEEQRILALAHWWLWLSLQGSSAVIDVRTTCLRDLQRDMSVLAVIRVTQAQRRYWREQDRRALA